MAQQQKGPDEKYCESCGEIIKKEAEVCPECGVRNKGPSGTGGGGRSHDPSEYETSVGGTWWYGVLAGVVVWLIGFSTFQMLPEPLSTIVAFIILIGWIVMPVAIFFDAKYVRANSKWNPSAALYIVGSLIWLLNILVGAVYLYRRHEALGTP